MKKIPSEFLDKEKIEAFVEENKDKKLCELFEVKEEYDVGDTESRCIEQLEPSVRVYNTFKRFKYNGIGKGFDPNENILNINVGELESKYRRFIGKRGIIKLFESLNDFLKDE